MLYSDISSTTAKNKEMTFDKGKKKRSNVTIMENVIETSVLRVSVERK